MKISNKYLVEGIVFFSYVLFAMAWVGGTASMSQIMASFDVETLASASFLSGAVTFAKIVGTFSAAFLAVKFGIKGAFFVSCVLIAVGLFTPLATSYDMLLISRFLMGLGGAFIIVYFNPVVMKWFTPAERPVINGINAVAFNVGTAIILWSMNSINLLSGSWKNSLILFSIASIVLALLWLFVDYEEPQSEQSSAVTEQKTEYGYTDGLKDSFNWYYAICYSGLLAFYICLFTFYPQAGIVATKWVIGMGIVGTVAGMFYSKKITDRIPVIRWSGLIQTLCIIGLSFSSDTMIQTTSAIILGFFIFFPVTALVTIPHELPGMTPDKITVVFSLFWSISYLIATVVLWLFGYLVDQAGGNYTQAFILITIISSSFFLGSFLLPEPKKLTA